MEIIDKDKFVAEIERRIDFFIQQSKKKTTTNDSSCAVALHGLLSFLDTLEVTDPYEQCVQYQSIKDGIEAHAETYSFNIESELFPQLTKEQQTLWRKEIEQACISGGDAGVTLARDQRYKENLEMKVVDLEKEYEEYVIDDPILNVFIQNDVMGMKVAKHFFELGLKVQKGEKV